MGSAAVASVQGLAPVALGQDSTEGREGGKEGWRKGVKKRGIEKVEEGERRGKNGEGRRILLQVK